MSEVDRVVVSEIDWSKVRCHGVHGWPPTDFWDNWVYEARVQEFGADLPERGRYYRDGTLVADLVAEAEAGEASDYG